MKKQENIKMMYKSLTWAMSKNILNEETDLKGDYAKEISMIDDLSLWGRIEDFYIHLCENHGWELTHNNFRSLKMRFPSVTRFLTICIYS